MSEVSIQISIQSLDPKFESQPQFIYIVNKLGMFRPPPLQ